MKGLFALLSALGVLLTLSACGEGKILHCDHCGREVRAEADSNMEEDWIIYCGECNKELFGEDGLIS